LKHSILNSRLISSDPPQFLTLHDRVSLIISILCHRTEASSSEAFSDALLAIAPVSVEIQPSKPTRNPALRSFLGRRIEIDSKRGRIEAQLHKFTPQPGSAVWTSGAVRMGGVYLGKPAITALIRQNHQIPHPVAAISVVYFGRRASASCINTGRSKMPIASHRRFQFTCRMKNWRGIQFLIVVS
jgi:hypothetical protein